MSSDDYLNDPRAPQDPEVAALERVLGSLRLGRAAAPERVLAAGPEHRPRRRPGRTLSWLAVPLVAAAAALWLWLAWTDDALHQDAGQRTFVTAAATTVTIPLGELATITLYPGSELEFLHWRGDEARFHLRRGRLMARVQPPPAVQSGFFVIDTPRGSVVDQGCQYELLVKDDGSARVRVTEGAVTFADVSSKTGVRQVFVPAGASAAMSATGVLGTPIFLDCSPALRKVVRRYDQSRDEPDAERRLDIVRKLAATCSRARDTLPLWHLLHDPNPAVPKMATEALFDLVGGPDGRTRSPAMLPAQQWLEFLRVAAWQAGG